MELISSLFMLMVKHIYPILTKWRDPDTGEGKRYISSSNRFYRERYEEEFQAILRDGVEYDEDGGVQFQIVKKKPLHNLKTSEIMEIRTVDINSRGD